MQGGETQPDAATAEEQARDAFLLTMAILTMAEEQAPNAFVPHHYLAASLLPHYLTTVLPTTEHLSTYQELDAFRASLDVRAFFLSAPRMPLCERIDMRCCQMLEGGLLEEVASSE
jgi:hypothetical protein